MKRSSGFWLGMGMACALVTATASEAHAAGVEDTVGGTVTLGRAAGYVRVHDFMATFQNPANLAIVPGKDLGLELRLQLFQACFDRAKDNAKEYKAADTFGQVCDKAAPMPSGNLGFAWGEGKWGWGVGVFTPSGTSKLKFGTDRLVTLGARDDETLPITKSGKQSPNRHMLIEREVLAGFLMAGGAWAPIRQLRLGGSVGVGFAAIKYKNAASVGPSFVDEEVINDVHVQDWAVPRATFSFVTTPVRELEIMGALTYTGDIKATGHVDIRANGIKGGQRRDCRAEDPGTFCRVDDAELKAPYHPLEATLGLRYAYKRNNAIKPTLDPMHDELWDLEVNAYWAQTSHVDAFTLTLYEEGEPNAPHIDFSSSTSDEVQPAPLPARARIAHNWRDTFGVRVGGDYNFIRDVLSARLGVSYESSAIRKGYMGLDYWPVQKVGLHAGGTVKFGDFRLSLAYAHIFNQEVDVGVGEGRVLEISAVSPENAQAVNEGRYISGIDIVTLQANYVF